MLDDIVRDLRHAARTLLAQRGFTATAILSLALGLGANSALFSMFNSLLWRPLPVEAPDELVVLYRKSEAQSFYDSFSYPEYQDYLAQATVFRGITGFAPTEFALGDSGAPGGATSRVVGESVTGNYFEVLGVHPALGRGFIPEEDRTGGPLVVVLGHQFWSARLHADPTIVGRTIVLNSQAVTVVGVAPEGFRGAYAIYFAPEFWVPTASYVRLRPAQNAFLTDRTATALRLMGRLAPGVSLAQAQAAAQTIAARLAQSYPGTNKGMNAFVFRELDTRPEVEIAPSTTMVAMIFLCLTGLVLLIACANVANLLLARAASRRREVAVRMAIGAGRASLIRQLLVESFLLVSMAGAAGVGLGAAATRLLSQFRVPTDLPLVLAFHTDARVVAFTVVLSAVAAVAFGLWPALDLSRTDLMAALKQDQQSSGRPGRRVTLAGSLVVAQVAASLVILVAAGLFVRSVDGARHIDPGFRTDGRFVLTLNPGLQGLDGDRARAFYTRVQTDVRALAGVTDAALASNVPLDFSLDGGDILVEGRAAEPGREAIQVFATAVDDHYFATLETPIRNGRAFTIRDTAVAPAVAIVNETLAATAWPGQDPIGRRIRFSGGGETPWLEVVGVSADGKYRQLTESPRPFVWTALAQQARTSSATLVVRADRDLTGLMAAVQRAVLGIDPAVPVYDVKTMTAFMERAYLGPKLASMVIAPAAGCALVIAGVGLYGVIACWVSRRTRELGVRAAVGASPWDILSLVMRQGLTLAGVGLVVGLAGAVALGRVLTSMLFGVSATDPLVFVSVTTTLAAVAAVASYIPARRAVRSDPLKALRQA